MRTEQSQAIVYGAIAGTAALGFALVAAATASRKSARVDRAVERHAHVPRRRRVGRAARGMAPLVKTYTMVPVAAAVSTWVLTRERDAEGVRRSPVPAAVAISASAVLGGLVEPLFDRLLPQPPMPGGRTHKKSIFPSGHTFKPSALALTCAHVLSREGLARPEVAYGAAVLLPAVSGAAKIVARKHWLSDVMGGALAGVAIGSVCCAGYEVARGG